MTRIPSSRERPATTDKTTGVNEPRIESKLETVLKYRGVYCFSNRPDTETDVLEEPAINKSSVRTAVAPVDGDR